MGRCGLMAVDVIVTTDGGQETARAVRSGGGLVGTRSSSSVTGDQHISFVDWPFQDPDPSVEQHVRFVRDHRPRYAVAPDISGSWGLGDVVDVAMDLEEHADTVIVVPKAVAPSRVPSRYRLGVPFRDGLETDIGGRSFPEYRGHGAVHILGGNPNEQLRLRDQFGFDVGSVDTPLPLAWADFGRVFMGAGGGGVEVRDLEVQPWGLHLELSRHDRIEFSVMNLVSAWNDRRIVVTVKSLEGVQTRGMPPILAPPDLVGGEEKREYEELTGQSYAEGYRERQAFEAAFEETELVEQFGDRARVQYDLFDMPSKWVDETTTETAPESSDMTSSEGKREWFKNIQEESDDAVDELGLGPGALPDPEDDEDDE